MKAKALFVKNPMKTAWASLIEAVITGLGCLAGFYFANTLLPNLIKKPADGSISPQPKLAPILTAVTGSAGVIMFSPGFLRSFALGFAAAGITDVVSDMVLKTADKQAKYGLTTKVDGLGMLANLDVDGLVEGMAGDPDLEGNDLDGFGQYQPQPLAGEMQPLAAFGQYVQPLANVEPLANLDPLSGFGAATVMESMAIN